MPRGGKRPGAGRPKGSRDTLRVVPSERIEEIPPLPVRVDENPEVTRARSDLIDTARTIQIKCLLGQIDPRTGEVQRKAALDILDAERLSNLSDASLSREVKRRNMHIEGARKPDLDAAEAAVLGGKHG
jgi:hypothetical protein